MRPCRVLPAIVLLVVAGCGSAPSEPQHVTLAQLVAEQEHYDGQVVISEGIVRSYDDPVHYWIEDGDMNRVELLPHDAVEDLVGHEIRVEGPFSFADDRGRVLDIDELEVIREHADA